MPSMAFVPDFGSVPDWVEALGTSGALGFLAVQLVRERKRDRETQERAAATKRDDEAKQARLISIKVSWKFGHECGSTEVDRPDARIWLGQIHVMNDSTQPIRRVFPYMKHRRNQRGPRWEKFPTFIDRWTPVEGDPSVLRPGQEVVLEVVPAFADEPAGGRPQHDDDHPSRRRKQLEHDFETGVSYVDAAGILWDHVTENLPLRMLPA